MADLRKVKISVVSQKGHCAAEHKVGDEFYTHGMTPKGICLSAFNALFPSLWALMAGGSFPWSENPDADTVACPDAANPVVFELRRTSSEK